MTTMVRTRPVTAQREFSLPYYENVLEFLAHSPSVQDIINYRPAVDAQSRFSELLEVNRQRALTAQEEEELEHYIRIDRMMALLKAKVYGRLGSGKAA